jgi:hypothetical protein
MSYEIDARLRDNQARLRIVEVETGRVRVAWDCPLDKAFGTATDQPTNKLELQRLFRELMLLSTLDKLRLGGGQG